MIVTAIIVDFRLISCFVFRRRAGADNWLIIAATVVSVANVICIPLGMLAVHFATSTMRTLLKKAAGIKYETGRHESTISKSESAVAVKVCRFVAYQPITLLNIS
jgi:hypothetical protein